jgi:hypothetical protein
MCTGHPPFRAESAVAVLRRVSDDQLGPVRQINPDIPVWLEAIIAKLHSKDAAGRFRCASELAELLSRCLAHVQEPLSVPLPPELVPSVTPTRSRRRRRLLWTGVGLLGVATIVGAVVTLWPVRAPVPPAPKLVSNRPRGTVLGGPSVVRPAPSAADEIEHPFQEAWGRAAAIEADLHRRTETQDPDSVSTLARCLADRAGCLERAIVLGSDPAPSVPTFPSPFQPR